MKKQKIFFLVLCVLSCFYTPCSGAGVRVDVGPEVRVRAPMRWQGPGFYFNIWFDTEAEYYRWADDYYYRYRRYPVYRPGYYYHRDYRHGDYRRGHRGGGRHR